MAWRGVYKACASVVSDVIAVDHWHTFCVVPIGVQTCEWVLKDHSFKFRCCHIANACEYCHSRLCQGILGQSIREQVKLARVGPAFFFGRVNAVEAVGHLFVIRDSFVRRDRPGGRGPDNNTGLGQITRSIRCRKRHPDRMRLVIVVLDLGFSQCRFLNRRPHHRFRALVQSSVHKELHEFFGDHTLSVEIHRQIGVFPIAGDAQTLEFFPLDVHPALGEFAAFLTEIDNVHVVLIAALLAVLLFDLPLNRQTVAIPTRHIARIKTHHLVAANDHVLDRLVQRVTDMQMTVRIGRSVVQGERLAAAVFGLVA